ncbi:hypothetical protein FQR65_LT08049 [Abscondita terminalis]|nr:hypothetical protein FQR65_LT08049 [Abscondita terminalis]
MLSYTIFLLLLLNVQINYNIVTAYVNPKLDNLITNVINEVSNEDDDLVFVYDNLVEFELPEVIKNVHVIARSNSSMKLTPNRSNLCIIHLSSQESINEMIGFLFEVFFSKMHLLRGGKVLIIINENNTTNVSKVFQHFWMEQIDKVIVLTYYYGREVFANIYTGYFFHQENDCGRRANVLRSQQYNQNVTIKYVEKYWNINRCEFILSELGINTLHPSFKYFFRLMDELAKRINGSFVKKRLNAVVPPSFIVVLNTGLADFLIVFDVSNVAIRDPFYFVVKSGEEISPIKILFIIFTFEVWIFILIAYIITSMAVWIVTSVSKKKFKISQFGKYSLEVLSATIWGSISSVPKRTDARCIFICYLIYHVHIQTGFSSNLVKILTTPQFEHGITNLEELASANITIYAHTYNEYYFGTTDEDLNKIYKIIKRKTKFIDLSYRKCADLLITENSGLFLTELEIKYLRYHFLRNVRVNVIDSSMILKNKPPIFGIFPGHMLNTFNRFIQSMEESGITQKYLTEAFDNLNVVPEIKDLIPLSLNHLLSVFVIVTFGDKLGQIKLFLEFHKAQAQIVTILRIYSFRNLKLFIELSLSLKQTSVITNEADSKKVLCSYFGYNVIAPKFSRPIASLQ